MELAKRLKEGDVRNKTVKNTDKLSSGIESDDSNPESDGSYISDDKISVNTLFGNLKKPKPRSQSRRKSKQKTEKDRNMKANIIFCFVYCRINMRLSLMLLFYGLSESVLVKRNVVFQKINEITTTRSRWLVTFVIDLNPYEQFLTKLENDFVNVEESLETIVKMFAATNSRGFLHPEIFFIGAVDNFRHELQSLKFSEGSS